MTVLKQVYKKMDPAIMRTATCTTLGELQLSFKYDTTRQGDQSSRTGRQGPQGQVLPTVCEGQFFLLFCQTHSNVLYEYHRHLIKP